MHTFLKSTLFAGLMALSLPAFGQVHLSISFGPPAPRYEVRGVAPFSGAVWIGGFYLYSDQHRNYEWTPGRWQAPPARGQVWFAPRYVRRGDSYDYYRGRWGAPSRPRAVSAPRRSERDNDGHEDNGNHNGQNKQNGNADHGNGGRGNSGHGNKGR